MDYFIICLFALLGSALTLFSGFGLGTLLLPVFGLFFSIDVAIIATAIVHFLNNLLKFFLFRKHANKEVVIKFGLPAVVFAFFGAYILNFLSDIPYLYSYNLMDKVFYVSALKISVGVLLILFAVLEYSAKLKNVTIAKKYLSLGGVLSGFFGGISGHQGALRSAFLIRLDLDKQAFIATGVVIACMVDVSRLSIYLPKLLNNKIELDYLLLVMAVLAAFAGVYIGNRFLQKTTYAFLHSLVAMLLFLYGILLLLGII